MSFFGIPIQTLGIALVTGVMPTLIWLAFWLREDGKKSEPRGLILLTFLAGMISVMLVLPFENWVYENFRFTGTTLAATAFIEEFGKFAVVGLIAFRSRYIDEPTDYAIYLITAGLGFAAFENTLFLLEPLTLQNVAASFLTGNLRFLGATVLHVVASGIIGVSMGLAFFQGRKSKFIHFIIGMILATTLHGLFNFFIMKATTQNIISIFAVVWAAAIVILLLFEKLKHMSRHRTYQPVNQL